MSKVSLGIFSLTCVFSNMTFGQVPAAGIAQKMQETCTRVCHGPSLIAQQRLDVAGWTREVNKMVGWGAEIAGSDKDELIRYLAGQFNTARSRPSSSQAVPEGKAKDVFQNSCLGCHDATTIARLKANRDGWTRAVERMIGWGAHVPPTRKEELIDYLLTNFAQ
jgi:hypothetical protein